MNKITAAMMPLLMAALAMQEIVANAETGQFELAEGAGNKLMTAFASKYSKALPVMGLGIAKDGSFSASAEQLVQLNAAFAEAEIAHLTSANQTAAATAAAAVANVNTLSNLPEPPAKPAANIPGNIQKPTSGWNAVTDDRPWNKLNYLQYQVSQGLASRYELMALEMSLNSTLVVDQMNQELGAYHREQNNSIKDMVWPTESNDANFPSRSTGTYDELPQTALFTSSFLQARNEKWAEKGKFEFQADRSKVKDFQMSYRFSEAELMAFMKSWLAEAAGKDHPFHESFMKYLSTKIGEKIRSEIQEYIINGVYQKPVDGVAGESKHAIEGLASVLIRKYDENRLLPFFVGKGDYIHHDVNGDPNPNHCFFKVQQMIDLMPQAAREGGPWVVAVSKDDKRQCDLFLQNVLLKNPNFAKAAETYDRPGFTIKAHPNWINGAIVIYQPGWILQGYREKGSENVLNFQREKRDTIVFMDGAHVIEPIFTGYQYPTRAALIAGKAERQLIFTNLEFGALSPAVLADKATEADGAKHFAFVTAANTTATTFSKINNLIEGKTYFLIGGSDTNPTTITSANANFAGLTSNLVLKANTEAQFLAVAGKLVLVGLRQILGGGVQAFAQDDQTPSLAGGIEFVVSSTNDAAKVNITDLTNPTIGATYTIYGASGTNTCVLKNGGRLALGADITMSTGVTVRLMFTNMNKFVKI